MARKKTVARREDNQKKHLVAQTELEVGQPLPDMLAKRKNKYLLVNLIGRRSRDLNKGEPSLVQLPLPHTHTQLAMAELERGKLELRRKAVSKVLVNIIDNE